ncbi:MAG TPA: CcmD family protein [Saprospiraceae bacterium]|nr:CcmD family protein [Saprospiraceae bacterium]
MKRAYATLFFSLVYAANLVLGQTSANQDFMRSTGKIYVVVAVILAIFLAIVIFLILLDRRLTKLENQIKQHGSHN